MYELANISDLVRPMRAGLGESDGQLAIVFFHVEQPADHGFHRMQMAVWDYNPVIKMSVLAAKSLHPEAKIVMLTDDTTQFLELPMQVVRLPLVKPWIMFERTRCQQAFTFAWNAPALHIDTDIQLLRRFDPLFNPADCSMFFTYRDGVDAAGMHINGGMIGCVDPYAFKHFMSDFVAEYEESATFTAKRGWNKFDLREMRGGQITLAKILHDKRVALYNSHWGRIRIHDCKQVNRTHSQGDIIPPGTFALHWKGPRKGALTQPRKD